LCIPEYQLAVGNYLDDKLQTHAYT
jgi:hypothetical protein